MDKREVVAGIIAGTLTTALVRTSPDLAIPAGAMQVPIQALLAEYGVEWVHEVDRLARLGRGDRDVRTALQVIQSKRSSVALLVDATDAMMRTDYESKIAAIRQAIADGVLYESGVKFDNDELVLRTVMAVDRPHVAVLIALGDGGTSDEDLIGRCPEYALVMTSLLGKLDTLGATRVAVTEPRPGEYVLDGHQITDLGKVVRRRFLESDGGHSPIAD